MVARKQWNKVRALESKEVKHRFMELTHLRDGGFRTTDVNDRRAGVSHQDGQDCCHLRPKTIFQSCFILTSTQPRGCASSSPRASRPTCD